MTLPRINRKTINVLIFLTLISIAFVFYISYEHKGLTKIPEDVTKLWVETYIPKEGEFYVGSSGEHVRLMAESTTPAYVTYTVIYRSRINAPNAETKTHTQTETVLIPKGKMELDTYLADDGDVTLTFNVAECSRSFSECYRMGK